jgi:glycosyltransferase involved in cell wall biosynthesis
MRPITLHILTRNNRATLEPTLRSAVAINGRILVADMGSTDGTQDLARSMGAFVETVDIPEDIAKLRNSLVARTKTDWQMFLEPGETIIAGIENLTLDGNAWHVSILQDDLLTKEIRIWNKKHSCFINPVYESIKGEAGILALTIYRPSGAVPELGRVRAWKTKQPTAFEPAYYEAMGLLATKQLDEFLRAAELYFFRQPDRTMATTMLEYYHGLVLSYYKDDLQQAGQKAVRCLADRPLMAEFWCLLGDIYYKGGEYKKAQAFYENGMILGSRRLKDDLWPLQISRYEEYPTTMIASCQNLLRETAIYIKKSDPAH